MSEPPLGPDTEVWRVRPRTAARPVVPGLPTVTLFVSSTTRATVSFSAMLCIGPTVSEPWSPTGVPRTMCTWPVTIGVVPAERVSTKLA